MNKEITKAMNKRPNLWGTFRKWWSKNGYIVMRIVLFPLWAVVWSRDKLNTYLNAKTEWSEERAIEILNYYIPRRADWDAEKKEFYFFDNGMGWRRGKKYIKLRDRRFWKLYSVCWGYKIRDCLINAFELEGFTKTVLDTFGSETEIVFTMRED